MKHFGNAHTDGDTVVYFPNLRVVVIGDLFTPDTTDPDFSAGGSLVDWGPVLGQILKLDFDVVVPSKGPMITRDDLVAFKTKIEIVVRDQTTRCRRVAVRVLWKIDPCPRHMLNRSKAQDIETDAQIVQNALWLQRTAPLLLTWLRELRAALKSVWASPERIEPTQGQ